MRAPMWSRRTRGVKPSPRLMIGVASVTGRNSPIALDQARAGGVGDGERWRAGHGGVGSGYEVRIG